VAFSARSLLSRPMTCSAKSSLSRPMTCSAKSSLSRSMTCLAKSSLSRPMTVVRSNLHYAYCIVLKPNPKPYQLFSLAQPEDWREGSYINRFVQDPPSRTGT
jgi:hypothetical protein